MSSTSTTKRPYLGKEERKKQLLEASCQLVESQGWYVLNMSTLADHVGVSRQLVYQHFPNLESLLTATAHSIFDETMTGTAAAIAQYPDDIRAAIEAAAVVSLDMPQGRGDALWQMIAGMNLGLPELDVIRRDIRYLVIGLWTPSAQKQLGLGEVEAKSLVWMMIMAFWGIRNLARDGLVTREQAIEQFRALSAQIFQASN